MEIEISPFMFSHLISEVVTKIRSNCLDSNTTWHERTSVTFPWKYIYGVPRGGFSVAVALSYEMGLNLLNSLENKKTTKDVLVVDDVVGTGETRKRYCDFDFACLHSKVDYGELELCASGKTVVGQFLPYNEWVTYPWEETESKGPEDAVVRQLEYIGEETKREGLQETPARVVKSWDEIYSGYGENPEDMITTFENDEYQQMVVIKDCELFSMCEHHLLPFIGKAHIAYIPNGRVIGASKLIRLLEVYARRAQIQERIGDQVTNALMEYLEPEGAACRIEAQHLCMMARGVAKQNSKMVTTSLKGSFLDDEKVREEFLSTVG